MTTTTTTTTELSPLDVAKKHERLHLLRQGLVLVDPSTGERLTKAEAKKEDARLTDEIKQYLAEHELDRWSVEGLPDIVLTPKTEKHIQLHELLESDPDIFYALVRLYRLSDFEAADKLLNPEQSARFQKHVHKLGAGVALGFEKK